jgi:CRISPR/Cas system CSM-associated protein Csm4 (group 5 of RAMP superfamily)
MQHYKQYMRMRLGRRSSQALVIIPFPGSAVNDIFLQFFPQKKICSTKIYQKQTTKYRTDMPRNQIKDDKNNINKQNNKVKHHGFITIYTYAHRLLDMSHNQNRNANKEKRRICSSIMKQGQLPPMVNKDDRQTEVFRSMSLRYSDKEANWSLFCLLV